MRQRGVVALALVALFVMGIPAHAQFDWGDQISSDRSEYKEEYATVVGEGVTQNARLLDYHVLTPKKQAWSGRWDVTCTGPNGNRRWHRRVTKSSYYVKTFKVPRKSRCHIKAEATALGERWIILELGAWRSGNVVWGEPCDETCQDLRGK